MSSILDFLSPIPFGPPATPLSPGPPPNLTEFNLAFMIAPIILQGGIAAQVQGQLLPITSLTGGLPTTPEQAFAIYYPLPGSTLIEQTIGTYPFANQSIAANAVIRQPLSISMLMIAPVNQQGGYLSKQGAFNALQQALQRHNAAEGVYIIATPAFTYTGLVMTSMVDVTPESSEQKQTHYQLNFSQPLLTLAGAAAAQNALVTNLTNGSQINNPSVSGSSATSTGMLTGIPAALAGAYQSVGVGVSNSEGFSASTGASPGVT